MAGVAGLVEDAARRLARRAIEDRYVYEMLDYDEGLIESEVSERWPDYVGIVHAVLDALRDDDRAASAIEAAALKWRKTKPFQAEGFGWDIMRAALDPLLVNMVDR